MKFKNIYSLHDIFPYWSSVLNSDDWNSLKRLGRSSILKLNDNNKFDLKYVLDDSSFRIELNHLNSKLDFFNGMTKSKLLVLSKQFDKNIILKQNLFEESSSGLILPSNAQDLLRKKSSTTLNNCSWCDYAVGGSFYDLDLLTTPYCSLIDLSKKEKNSIYSGGCFLLKKSASDLKKLVINYESNKNSLLSKEKKRLSKLKPSFKFADELGDFLVDLSVDSQEKPLMNYLRDPFNKGDSLNWFLYGSDDVYDKYINTSLIGSVVSFDRLGPLFYSDKKFHSGDLFEGRAMRCYSYANRIHSSTLDYMKSDLDFTNIWIKTSSLEKEFTLKDKLKFKNWLLDYVG